MTLKWKESDKLELDWHWIAIYTDDSIIKQFENDGTYHKMIDIEQKKLFILKLINRITNQQCSMIFEPEKMNLIPLTYNITTSNIGNNPEIIKLYFFGYEYKDIGTQHYTVIIDNEIIQTTDINKIVIE